MHNKRLWGNYGKDAICKQCLGFHDDAQGVGCLWCFLVLGVYGVFLVLFVGSWGYHGVGCFWLGGFLGAFGLL